MAFLQAGFPTAAAGATGRLNSGALYRCASATHAALSGLRIVGSKNNYESDFPQTESRTRGIGVIAFAWLRRLNAIVAIMKFSLP